MTKCVLLSLMFIFLPTLLSAQGVADRKARLLAIVDKTELRYGESFHLTITYEVDDDNTVPLQFNQPGKFLSVMIQKMESLGFIKDKGLDNIYGERHEKPDGKSSTRYGIFEADIKPRHIGTLIIPSFELGMYTYQKDDWNEDGGLKKEATGKEFFEKSEPVKISVINNPFFPNATAPPLIGQYAFQDYLNKGEYSVGDTIDYVLSITGTGQGLNLLLPEPPPENFRIITRRIVYTDSSSQPLQFNFEKRYLLSLVPLKAGEIILGDYFHWSYKTPGADKVQKFGSSRTLQIGKNGRFKESKPPLDIMLAIDISESMEIEDYQPNRKGKAIQLAKAYLTAFANGRVMAFAGSTVDLSGIDNNISVLDTLKIKNRGTAIGNAVWLGAEALHPAARKKVIIIIGDGDRTAGNVSTTEASFFAKNQGVRVFTIGIGTTGRVPFGKDFYGQPEYVENTFSSVTLKQLAELTGGKYYHLGKEDSPEDLIRKIKKEIESY